MTVHLTGNFEIKGNGMMIVPVAASTLETQLGAAAALSGISLAQLSRDFQGKAGEKLMFYPANADGFSGQFILAGLGETADPQPLRQAVREAVQSRPDIAAVWIDLRLLLPENRPEQLTALVSAAVEGCLLGDYRVGRFKTADPGKAEAGERQFTLLVDASQLSTARIAARRGEVLAGAQRRVMDLVNAPSNQKTPEMLGDIARALGKSCGFSTTRLSREAMETLGLGGLLAVNQGSTLPPAFIIMEYRPKGKSAQNLPHIGLVGKGVTFDTGGISLKPSDNLQYLKSDMAGGAVVIATMEAAARLSLPLQLTGIVPATDNMPDGAALNPGDVIHTYSGQTVEVIDTDAEGRLILADGLAYLKKHFDPEIMIDLATLTGAAVISLGSEAAALFSNSDALAGSLAVAGEHSGERVWRLPLFDGYSKAIDSAIADVKNYGGKAAGAATAAKFLEKFIDNHPAWAHLDIAGMVLAESGGAPGRVATGYGVRLLTVYLEGLGGKKV